MTVQEPTNIGLSEATHAKLKRLKEEGHFREMQDAYRFGIGLALAQGVIDPPELSSTTTVFGVATIDPDQTLRRRQEGVRRSAIPSRQGYPVAPNGTATVHSAPQCTSGRPLSLKMMTSVLSSSRSPLRLYPAHHP